MQKSNIYRVEVAADTDFIAGWKDPATPHVDYMFDQESLDECEEVDGQYFATYKTWVVEQEKTVQIVTATGTEILTIPVGEYGKLK
jgi:hypothetical protein